MLLDDFSSDSSNGKATYFSHKCPFVPMSVSGEERNRNMDDGRTTLPLPKEDNATASSSVDTETVRENE
jgi:hypothetical protein